MEINTFCYNPHNSYEKYRQQIGKYIEDSQEFAKPILTHLRKLIHATCPGVIETTKWGMPYFEYKGNLCGMAAFTKHCAFGFWKESIETGIEKNKPKS